MTTDCTDLRRDAGTVVVHRLLPYTRAEGPGARAALWVQGCSIRCPGCFNPGTWTLSGGQRLSVEQTVAALLARPDIEGVTFLGGEPFDQAPALARVGAAVRDRGLSVMTFSGHEYDALLDGGRPGWSDLLAVTDLLLDGPYVAALTDHRRPWVGSSNQGYRFLTPRYRHLAAQLDALPDRLEVRLHRDGRVEVNGMAEAAVLKSLLDGLGRRRGVPRCSEPPGARGASKETNVIPNTKEHAVEQDELNDLTPMDDAGTQTELPAGIDDGPGGAGPAGPDDSDRIIEPSSDSPEYQPYLPDPVGLPTFDPTSMHAEPGSDPAADMQLFHPPQTADPGTLVCSESIIRGLTGEDVSETDLMQESIDNGWYIDGVGTPLDDVGKVLEAHGVQTETVQGITSDDLAQHLANGEKVMVRVDQDELRGTGDEFGDAPTFDGGMAGQDANMAVQVIGVTTDENGEQHFIVNDPQALGGGAGKLVPVETFERAWEDSGNWALFASAPGQDAGTPEPVQ